jgi:hypothetical protein
LRKAVEWRRFGASLPAFLDELLDLPGHERQRHTPVADEACTGGCVGR